MNKQAKKKKRGLRFAVLGIVFGITIGFGILGLKSFIIGQLEDVLNEEAQKACNCTFVADTITLSLLRLRGVAHNARIIKANGEPGLLFRKVTARFSLSALKSKQILLTDLHLIRGVAYGVDDSSVAYRFIDSLTEPPSASASPDRWKLRLEQLRVSESRFTQDYPGTFLSANHISMLMERNSSDDFVLYPTIGSLQFTLKKSENRPFERTIKLGKVSSEVTLSELQATFNNTRLRGKDANIAVVATSQNKQGNLLNGTADLDIHSNLLQLGTFLDTRFTGKATVGGSLGNPTAKGALAFKANQPKLFSVEDIPLLYLTAIAAQFDYDMNHGKHQLQVSNIEATGEGTQVKSTKALFIDDTHLSAGFAVSVDTFSIFGVECHSAEARVEIDDELDDLGVTVRGSCGSATVSSLQLPALNYNLRTKPSLQFDVQHSSAEAGKLLLEAALHTDSNTASFERGTLTLENFKVQQSTEHNEGEDTAPGVPMRLSGDFNFSGPTSFYSLTGKGTIAVTSKNFSGESALKGNTSLEEGIFSASVKNNSDTFEANARLNLNDEKGVFGLSLNKFRPADYSPEAKCMSFTGGASYTFPLSQADTGNGSVTIEQISLGCLPYAVTTEKAKTFPINQGTLQIDSLTLASDTTSLSIEGTAAKESLNLHAQGSLFLNALLGFIPSLDDLSGNLAGTFSVTGSFDKPKLNGQASVSKGGFASEAADIFSSDIQGELILDDNNVSIQYINGRVNGGSVSAEGSVDILAFSQSELFLTLNSIGINAIPDTTATTSADLHFSLVEKKPHITGTVTVDVLEFRKDLNMGSVLTSLLQPTTPERPSVALVGAPSASLDVSLQASRNIFVYSNFLTAELAANMHVGGTTDEPRISGTLTTLSGWLGLKNRRFDITSGSITFEQDPSNPVLEIIGETSVFTRSGNFVTIIMEARGTLANPEIILSSDTGLSQGEILNLLTSDVRDIEGTRANSLAARSQGGQFSLIEQQPGSPLRNVLHSVTTIDDLTIQPALNNRSGAIEPALTASKFIMDDVAIVGEYFLGPEALSRVRIRYDFLPYLNLAGTFDTLSTEENSNIGIDLTLTIFARNAPFISYTIEGNPSLSKNTLLQGARLTQNSRIKLEELGSLTKQLQKVLANNAFKHALVVLNCLEVNVFCKELNIKIFEGPRMRIAERRILGDPLPVEIPESRLPSVRASQPATDEYLQFQTKVLTELLRSEGYLSAQVLPSYQELPDHSAVLLLQLQVGAQESFIFNGNTVFTPSDFLQTINLFNRKQPFGRNTIKILLENMERMYREAGYLYASIDYEKQTDPLSNKTTYQISIREEIPVEITEVVFVGNDTLPRDELQTLVKEYYPGAYDATFDPKVLIDENVRQVLSILENVYKLKGFPNATAQYEVVTGDNEESIEIRYLITEGDALVYKKLQLSGLPNDDMAITLPEAPYSVPIVNKFLQELEVALDDQGYFNAAIHTDMSSDILHVQVSTGQQTKISSIVFEGLRTLSSQAVHDFLQVSSGDAWVREELQQHRRTLLTRGLFSRVEFLPADGSLDSEEEELLIRFVERPLTTLEIGGGLNSELGIHVFGEAIDKSIFLNGNSLGLRSDIFFDQQDGQVNRGIAGLRYTHPSIFGSDFQLTQDARFQKTDLDTLEYDQERYILDSSLYRSSFDALTMNLSYALSQDRVTNVPFDVQLSNLDSGIVDLSILGASLRWDQRDSPVLPSNGFLTALDTRVASEAIGSDANYFSLGGRLSYIVPLFESRFSFSHRIRGAAAWVYSGTTAVPITQRFYLGGRQNLRGFRENSLGPRGVAGNIIGGDIFLQNNFEIAYRLAETVSTHVFLDCGNVFLRERSTALDDLRYSSGIGVRYLSPIGPIGFDVGGPLDERPGEPSLRLHFTIGSTF